MSDIEHEFPSVYANNDEANLNDSEVNEFQASTKPDLVQSAFRIVDKQNIDEKFGFTYYKDAFSRIGWLINFHSSEAIDEENRVISALDLYFLDDKTHTTFKVSFPYRPYFYISTKKGLEQELTSFLVKKYGKIIKEIILCSKEDLDLMNHLSGLKQNYLKLLFNSVNDLLKVRKEIFHFIEKNKKNIDINLTQMDSSNPLDNITDIREYDVPYHVRVAIDNKFNVGNWYSVKTIDKTIHVTPCCEIVYRPDNIVIFTFDIETTKCPLKFPDQQIDKIMMISYMIGDMGYLIVNREVVTEDIENFDYIPKQEFSTNTIVFNVPDERALLLKFFSHINHTKPHVFVTYNGDYFDWPFIETRSKINQINMYKEIGVYYSKKSQAYECSYAIHMDCLYWVRRDSYLPVGSQGLKAVSKSKLHYDPIELDPELMVKMALENPQVLASYSISDSVATYYLYYQYVHPFIFSLCTVIPMEPDEVLRKGSGTLCEALLMVQAFQANIIFPNKNDQNQKTFTSDGHLLESETYVGGHVEALESGVFRADIPMRFRLDSAVIQKMIDQVPEVLKHSIEKEYKTSIESIPEFQTYCEDLRTRLKQLQSVQFLTEKPLIYHLDVGAMYPNIILTNRLQPSAVVNDSICANCDMNKPGAKCQRRLEWTWRGDYLSASHGEYQHIAQQLEVEEFPWGGQKNIAYAHLPPSEQTRLLKKRVKEYSKKVYRKAHVVREEERKSTVCQCENSFYVDTVMAFRDRRYEYKEMTKKWKNNLNKPGQYDEEYCKSMAILYDSLQLAHKCILNSFYGYVMRRGSRWFSMEMAGIVCYIGAQIIKKAREIISGIGTPLELDTDGIWCVLPKSFPDLMSIKTNTDKVIKISFPGAILNHMLYTSFTNEQFHNLDTILPNGSGRYSVKNVNTIFFEVDGPYKAMILPAAKEEGKKLKKRYAVFNFDDELTELKGFEMKRRGELELIKNFQTSLFKNFLAGHDLHSCYNKVAEIANYWLDILHNRGKNLPDEVLIELLSENRVLSKKLSEYGSQKSTSITTAKRLAEFLGDQMIQDKGLCCRYIISKFPTDVMVTEKALPIAIFQTNIQTQGFFLKKWTRQPHLDDFSIRSLLDWEYYVERLNSAIQKIIVIPAALQGVGNPVPRCPYPDWLHRRILNRQSSAHQFKITDHFTKTKPQSVISTKENIPTKPPAVLLRWKEKLGEHPKFPVYKKEISGWVQFLKNKWLCQTELRNKLTTRNHHAITTPVALASTRFFSQKKWPIIKTIPQKNSKNLFDVLVLKGGMIKNFVVEVPKVFYINYTNEPNINYFNGKKIKKMLPRCKPSEHLYQIEMSFDEFEKNSNLLLSISTLQEVEGIYELQVPAYFQMISKIGNQFHLRHNLRNINNDNSVVSLSSLETCDFQSKQKNYHDITNNVLNFDIEPSQCVYFCNYIHMEKFGIAAIFAINQAHVLLLTNQVQLQSQFLSENFQKIKDELCTLLVNDGKYKMAEFVKEEHYEFTLKNFHSISQMHKHCNRIFTELVKNAVASSKDHLAESQNIGSQSTKKLTTPLILLLQSNLYNQDSLKEEMNALKNFTIIQFPQYSTEDLRGDFYSIDWQREVAKKLLHNALLRQENLKSLQQASHYLDIPIGNFYRSDTNILALDLKFARLLNDQQHILWYSPKVYPDFGNHRSLDLFNNESLQNTIGNKHIVDRANYYSSLCVELRLEGLAIASILQASTINETYNQSVSYDTLPSIAFSDILSNNKSAIAAVSSYDETSSCFPIFKILQKLVFQYMKDVNNHKNVIADEQLLHIYSSTKIEQQHAWMNISYVIKYILSQNLFSHINLVPVKAWRHLLWKDKYNHGGIQCPIPEIYSEGFFNEKSSSSINKDSLISTVDLPNYRIEINFDLCNKMENIRQTHDAFKIIIGSFIDHCCKSLENLIETNPNEPPSTLLCTHIEERASFIRTELTIQLFEIINDIHYHHTSLDADLSNLSFSFILIVTAVLQLDQNIEETTLDLRRKLLKRIEISEFAFDEGCLLDVYNFNLEQVFCNNCNSCHDLDLIRDPMISTKQDGTVSIQCATCFKTYDKLLLENSIIKNVNSTISNYLQQDYVCNKCKNIRDSDMKILCDCDGGTSIGGNPYSLTLFTLEYIQQYLNSIKKIAEYYFIFG